MAFNWVLATRPDLRWNFPIGDIRRFKQGFIYTEFMGHSEMSDAFAMVSRELFPTYASAARNTNHPGNPYHCVTKAQMAQVKNEWLCNFSSPRKLCLRCWFGNNACLLQLHLNKHAASLSYLPGEI